MTGSIAADAQPHSNDFLGRYQLLARLGHGALGVSHLAMHAPPIEDKSLVVIKQLRRELARDEEIAATFLREGKLAVRLDHPNIGVALEANTQGSRAFVATEFLDGQSLISLLERATESPEMPLTARIGVLCEVLAGLHYAHELADEDGLPLNIVHGDVSPQNVFITYEGQTKLLNFGIAKALDATYLRGRGVFGGRFAYASPERVQGRPLDRRSDVFSVGIMLWEAVTLRHFSGATPNAAAIEARIAGTEPGLASVQPDISPLLAEICTRAMHADPAQRYASAEAFRIDLERFVTELGDMPGDATRASCLQTKFASERVAMQRLIESHIRHPEPNDSDVRARRASGSISVEGQVLAVDGGSASSPSGVSEPSERSGRSEHSVSALSQPALGRAKSGRSTRLFWWITAAVAFGIAFASFLWVRASEPHARDAAVGNAHANAREIPKRTPASVGLSDANNGAPSHDQTNPRRPLELELDARSNSQAQTGVAGPEQPQPSAASPSSQPLAADAWVVERPFARTVQDAARGDGDPARRPRGIRRARSGVDAVIGESGADHVNGAIDGSDAQAAKRWSRPRRARASAAVSGNARVGDATDGASGNEMGDDLRHVRPAPKRQLDTEDPFQ
jgi:serine/threonine protein kinase